MNFATWGVTSIMIWWVFFFMVLPWGNEPSQNISAGFEKGAPQKPRLVLKLGITSFLTVVFCLLIHLLTHNGWVNFKVLFS